jgi:hypothetical protein
MTMSTRPLGAPAWATIILLLVEIAMAVALAATGSARIRDQQGARSINRRLVRELGLTDLALSSGTSYTRHPSQADLFAPHNEHPSAIEHFPAGSVLQPPAVPPGVPLSATTGAVP